MPVTERICPMCEKRMAIQTDEQADGREKQSGSCPHCGITIKFEERISFAVSAPLPGGTVERIWPR